MQSKVLAGWVVMSLMTAGSLMSAAVDVSLVEAVEQGDREAVRSLLAGHADVNAREADGATALAWAVHRDDLETATLLLEAGADVNAANDYGVTPLTLACANGNSPMVEKLLDAGADPDKAQWTGETPLMTCASTGIAAAVSALVAAGADLEAKESKKGQTALMWAVAEKHPAVVKVLVAAGADVHARSRVLPRPEPYMIESTNLYGSSYGPNVYFPKTSGGFTPLLFAARNGDVDSARALLAAGADMNVRTQEAGSALVVAAASGHESLALLLLEKGADPNATDAHGITPLHYALNKGLLMVSGVGPSKTDSFGWTRENSPELVRALLSEGADPNARIAKDYPYYDYAPVARTIGNDHPQISLVGVTPFMLASASGDVAVMRTLVEGRADPKLETPESVNPLILASGLGIERGFGDERSALEAVKLLVALGGDVNAPKEDGRTPVHSAALLGWNSVIEYLAAQGADLDAKDMYGQTPVSVALGDPEGLIYRQLPGGRYDDRFRNTRERKKTAELLVALGAKPFPGKYRDRTGQ